MNIFFKFYCRAYQAVLKIATCFLSWRTPELITGAGNISRLPSVVKSKGLSKALIVTGKSLYKNGYLNNLEAAFIAEGMEYVIFNKSTPNPTVDLCEQARQAYIDNACDCIVAFGGGSPIDCAKGAGARIARPKKPLSKMKGVLKVIKKLPPLFAVPTTAGSGSETTLAAVITDAITHDKYAINDTSLIPNVAVLDPEVTVNLPKHITSTTGMDALTHAVEAYIGRANTKNTIKWAEQAIVLIHENLLNAYQNPTDLKAREGMQLAAFYAGKAFTRAYVGYVHALAHAFGGLYNIPHGLANAVLLPVVLQAYGSAVHKKLAHLASLIGLPLCQNDEDTSNAFITWIKNLNLTMQIPATIKNDDGSEVIKDCDIPLIIKKAFKETNPLYPVPRILPKTELCKILKKVK